MSATEDDTELRDLLIQNLENNGVLNKLKAEMRAAVFLAMDEQDKVENKTPLVNGNLKKCLNTKDGCLVTSLIIDFLQVFNLDFTLAVFQPEINSLNGLDSREQVSRELGIPETDINKNAPLLLELIKKGRHKDKSSIFSESDKATSIPKELSPLQIANARKKFDVYDKDRSGGIHRDDLKSVFGDLFPSFNKSMLEKYVTDELRSIEKAPSKSVDFQEFLGLYKRLFIQCRSVVTHDNSDVIHHSNRFSEEKMCTLPASKGTEGSHSDTSLSFGSLKGKGQTHMMSRRGEASGDNGNISGGGGGGLRKDLDLEVGLEVEEEADEGDSFFDDPLPKPQKNYSCSLSPERGESLRGRSFPQIRRDASLNEMADSARSGGSPLTSLSDAAPQKSAGGSHSGEAGHRGFSGSRNGTSNSKEKGLKDLKAMNDKTGSLVLEDDVDYDDDFNSHRSDLSKSEVSIGEEIDVSIEGPDTSDKFDETTQDLSVSQISQAADYIEKVA